MTIPYVQTCTHCGRKFASMDGRKLYYCDDCYLALAALASDSTLLSNELDDPLTINLTTQDEQETLRELAGRGVHGIIRE
jgi:hypothetical protein